MSASTKRVAEKAKAGGGGAAAPAPRVSTQRKPIETTPSKSQTTAARDGIIRFRQSSARLVDEALRGTPYAVIGGLAHQLLGSKRGSCEFDIFVPTGYTARVCDQLAAASSGVFKKSGNITRTMNLDQDGDISRVRIHEPQAVHQAFPTTDDGFVTLFSTRVLKPALLLNIAIYDWMEQHKAGVNDWKKKGANADIIFLADYIAKKEREDMKHATPAFLDAFFASNDNQEPVFFSIGLKRPAVKASGSGSGSTNTVVAQGQTSQRR